MSLPPFPEGYLPASPREKLLLVQWGEQCRAMYKEDAERLDWLMLHVSGRELRRLNVWTSAGCDRAAIDAARGAQKETAPAPLGDEG